MAASISARRSVATRAACALWVDDLGLDLRYGARMLARTPGFTAVAVLSLALGIGANTAIFTLFDAILLKPLPVDRPEELRTTNMELRIAGRGRKSNDTVTFRLYKAIAADPSIFSEVLAFTPLNDPNVSSDAGPLPSSGGLFVSANYFRMLGLTPELGRLFDPEAGPGGDAQTAVLADSFWRREFRADPGVLGRSIRINDVPFTIAGVAPVGFTGLTIGRMPDFFLSLDDVATAQPGIATVTDQRNWTVQIVGRARTGLTDRVAVDRLRAVRDATEPPAPGKPEFVFQVLPIETGLTHVRARFFRPLTVLVVMVAILLVIACANVATMLLSRASARKAEMVIRAAIGAGQGRLLRQLATESALLSALAGIAGVVFAAWATRILLVLMQMMDPSLAFDLTIDRRMLTAAVALSAVSALIAGLTPALHTVRANAGSVLKDRHQRGSGGGIARLGQPFVIAQVALALSLVVGAGLLARTLYGLATVDAGFRAERVVLASVNPAMRGYKDAALRTYFQELYARISAAAGIESATLVQFSFLIDGKTTGTFEPPGFTAASEDERWVQIFQVGPRFFSTMGMSIVAGRDFSDEDMNSETRAIALNEAAARRYFGSENPVGRIVGTDRIIAIVRDARYNTLREDGAATMFYPYLTAGRGRMTVAVRVAAEQSGAATVLARIRELDPQVPVTMTTLEEVVRRSLGQERLLAAIASFFGGTALLLLCLGLYGVTAFWVAERTSEIGVRVALGARRSQVMWAVLRRPLMFVGVGGVIGVLSSLAGARFIANLLYGLAPQDPATIAGAALLIVAVAGIAAIVPVRRALRVDPVVALRCE